MLKNMKLVYGGSTAVFEQTGKGKITYSHCQHTRFETLYHSMVQIYSEVNF